MTRAEERISRREAQQEAKRRYEQFMSRASEEIVGMVLDAVVIELINHLAELTGRQVEVKN